MNKIKINKIKINKNKIIKRHQGLYSLQLLPTTRTDIPQLDHKIQFFFKARVSACCLPKPLDVLKTLWLELSQKGFCNVFAWAL